MVFALHAIGISATKIEQFGTLGERCGVAIGRSGCDGVDPGALDHCRGSGEVFVDQRRRKADRIECLRTAVALKGRNAHFRHDLEDALSGRLAIISERLNPEVHSFDRVVGEVRIDRFGAIACKHAEMVDLARFAGFHHQPGLHAQTLADQLVMDRAGRERDRDRDSPGSGRTVGKDQDVAVAQHRFGCLPAQSLQRRFEDRA